MWVKEGKKHVYEEEREREICGSQSLKKFVNKRKG